MDKSPYLCPLILGSIRTEPHRKSTYEFKDPDIEVVIWSPLQGPVYDHEYLARLTHALTRWIRTKSWSRVNPSHRWTIEIYLHPMEKRWCATDTKSEIGICQVNSGETEQTRHSVRIRIVRAQCCVRTILHELLHGHLWDRLVPTTNVDDSEGVVEACARLFYCQWFGRSQWREMLNQEIEHTRKQVDFLRHSEWTTTTHVQGYYFLTLALLHSLENLTQWLDSSRHSSSLRAAWPKLKEHTWKKLYGVRPHDSIQQTPRKQGCISLAMVKYQVPITVREANLTFLKPPRNTGSARRGGSAGPGEWVSKPKEMAVVTLLVAPRTTTRFVGAAPRSVWMVTDGQGHVGPVGWLMRGQTFQVGNEALDLVLRNENRWRPFIVVQLA
jgi:hypothetical protein